jgi:hypothetical protein
VLSYVYNKYNIIFNKRIPSKIFNKRLELYRDDKYWAADLHAHTHAEWPELDKNESIVYRRIHP